MHYIGMDCHISTSDFAVVNEVGRLVKANSVATGVNAQGEKVIAVAGTGAGADTAVVATAAPRPNYLTFVFAR